jgi:tRNA pseudouridine55 synthase
VTRLLRFLTELPKSYTAEVVFGVATNTLDDDGEVTGRWEMHVTAERVRAAAEGLTGAIMQVPPMVSAVRVGGRRLHELARAGIEVERQPRPVRVHRLELTPTADDGVWMMDVTCSSGTYVRVLAADLGTSLGGGAHLRRLRRTSIGSFRAENASPLDVVEHDPPAALLTPADALADYATVRANADVAELIAHGRRLPADVLGATGDGPWAVIDDAGRLVAVYENASGDELLRPAVVMSG